MLIDITRLLYRRLLGRLPTGIDRVAIEYVRHYAASGRAVLTIGPFDAVLSPVDSAHAFALLLDERRKVTGFFALMALKGYFLWWWMSRNVAGNILLNVGHFGLENKRYAMLARRRGARAVFMLHDLIPITHPQFCLPRATADHLARLSNAVKLGAGIIANSRHTLDALSVRCEAMGLALPPTTVAPLASRLPAADTGKRPMASPYFVMLGTIEPRKNHLLILRLWQRLIERDGDAAPRLVVIGQEGWQCQEALALLRDCSQLRGFVFEKRACNDAELTNFLHHAQALVFPSFAEGYGLPLAEALAQGIPVIASDLPSFREISDQVPEYLDPHDEAGWLRLINAYATNESTERTQQLTRIAGFMPSTWAAHFAIVDAFLDRLSREAA